MISSGSATWPYTPIASIFTLFSIDFSARSPSTARASLRAAESPRPSSALAQPSRVFPLSAASLALRAGIAGLPISSILETSDQKLSPWRAWSIETMRATLVEAPLSSSASRKAPGDWISRRRPTAAARR